MNFVDVVLLAPRLLKQSLTKETSMFKKKQKTPVTSVHTLRTLGAVALNQVHGGLNFTKITY